MGRSDSVEQRRTTLELLLLWEGLLNRARLKSLLDLGDARASQWIQEFRDAYPRWLTWNSKSRSYHATHEAYVAAKRDEKTRGRAESLAKYLSLVGLPYVASDTEATSPICAAFPDLSTPEPQIFATLSRSIRLNLAVEITYRSMKEPAPHQRIISPHHLVRAGRRWHLRAFCSTHQDFRDYALGRIVNVMTLALPSERLENDDAAWNAKVPVRLIAHPDLSREQEDVIRLEYFNNTSARVITCRGALVGYLVQDVRAATNVKRQRPPEYQLAVANVDEVSPWLFP
ncbi:hypothetical protein GALL_203750 [mine drainage metagenome]|uniref:Uncharacterized protein n=1 Tax=mine drainage metagenome TaxID=410659 RepID=A0A1J5RMZ6_9ZZZZ